MQFLFNLFSKLFAAPIQRLIDSALMQDQTNRTERAVAANLSRLSGFINAPVICFDIDIGNPVVGIGLRIGYDGANKVQRLIVRDYLTGRETMVRWKIYPYSRPLLAAAFDLDKKALMPLMWQDHEAIYYREFNPSKEPLLTYEAGMEVLIENKFFAAVDAHYLTLQAIGNVSQLTDPLALQDAMTDPTAADIIQDAKDGVYGRKS